jgi:hypothetical protein
MWGKHAKMDPEILFRYSFQFDKKRPPPLLDELGHKFPFYWNELELIVPEMTHL